MISFDFTNCLAAKIGSKNGLAEKDFQAALKQNANIKKILQNKRELGFLNLPFESIQNLQKIEKEGTLIRKNFKNIFFIGIGGSSLGGIALQKSLKPFYNELTGKNHGNPRLDGTPHVYFLDNPDSDYLNFLLQNIDLKKTLLIPISKSGGTIESLAIFSVLYTQIKKLGGAKAKNHVIIITEQDKNSLLYRLHQKEGFKTYSVPKNVGGRFSVLCNVGLLPAAIMGINIRKLLKGAQNASIETAYQLSLIQYFLYEKYGKTITVFFPYGRKLEAIADWYIQLLAESIGKNDKVGPTPLKAIGAMDQHAQMQLFMEGPKNKLVIFVESKNEKKLKIPEIFPKEKAFQALTGHEINELLLAERKASAEALAARNRPNLTLTLPEICEESIGELLFLLELQVALLGELFKINAFNQPGVELGKKLTLQYLENSNQKY